MTASAPGPRRVATDGRSGRSIEPITFPETLPITTRLPEIAALLRAHQVVVVAGETGSGKTTQLPKLCLQLGRGNRQARIAHTQPRRLAARTVADRIAEELGTPPGTLVGSRIRFSDRTSKATSITVMTDGVLLAEIARDRLLRRYDVVIVDEAHERSLNIDFLLGYLAQLLPQRRDLRVVITSATIDPRRFAAHFAGVLGKEVPVIEVSGRTYPVEVRYRPFGPGHDPPEDERDQVQAVLDAVDELADGPAGDVLVFLSGEREIRDTADALREHLPSTTDVLPLYARLSAAEQHRVFDPHGGRRIVLATNVAETSLTVPGIRFVVDAGTARVSRYSLRTKVQRLPIEPISQASADQRKGRCGRVSAGVCIRLYAEEDFRDRPLFTDPEILRTNLAAVILRMADVGLGEVEAFPFLDPPDRRSLRDGLALLEELGALEPTPGTGAHLTGLGRRLARLPVDPRLGRMVLAAAEGGCVQEVLVIAAALSIQDPRERPEHAREEAAAAHRRFTDPASDLITYLNLWAYLQDQQRAMSGSAFRRRCRSEHLHYLRVREWQDLVTQLRQACRELDIAVPAHPDLSRDGQRAPATHVHQAALGGLLSQIGTYDQDRRDYTGTRNARFAINPGSALAKQPPRWVMAGELVETTRVWARDVARIDPAWIERAAPAHLLRRSFSEPRWDRGRAAAVATEKVMLYGLTIVAARTVPYARVDPEWSRELFLRHALVDGDWDTHHEFLRHNRALLDELGREEERGRRRDLVVDDEAVHALYAARIPDSVVSGRHFDRWWRRAGQERPDQLSFAREDLLRPGAAEVDLQAFPDVWSYEDLTLALRYRFEPGSTQDGVSVQVPLAVLDRLDPQVFSWQVPGLREDLVVGLIRSLPKALRRSFVPAPDHGAAALALIEAERGDGRAPTPGRPRGLPSALAAALTGLGGPVLTEGDFDTSALPTYLQLRFVVLDGAEVVGEGRDLRALQEGLGERVRDAVREQAPGLERSGLTGWVIGDLPRRVEVSRASGRLQAFPALVDEGSSVGLRLMAHEAEAQHAMARGLRRMLLLELPSSTRAMVAALDAEARLALATSPYPDVPSLLADCAAAAVDRLVAEQGGPVWEESAYITLRERVRAALPEVATRAAQDVARVLGLAGSVRARCAEVGGLAVAAREDVEVQLDGLVFDSFVSATGLAQLAHLPRYLRAMLVRLDGLAGSLARDLERMAVVHDLEDEYLRIRDAMPEARTATTDLIAVRWLLEELRVSLFAQQLGTAHPVSAKRVRTALRQLEEQPSGLAGRNR